MAVPSRSDVPPLRSGCQLQARSEEQTTPLLDQQQRQAVTFNRNLKESPLCWLPKETLWDIDDMLPPTASLVLRATSKHLRMSLQPRLRTFYIDSLHTRNSLANMLRRDRYANSICFAERHGLLARSEKSCSACRSSHPEISFSEHQLQTEPEHRVCRGCESKFRLCEHRQLSASDLLTMRTEFSFSDLLWEPLDVTMLKRGHTLIKCSCHDVHDFGARHYELWRSADGKRYRYERKEQLAYISTRKRPVASDVQQECRCYPGCWPGSSPPIVHFKICKHLCSDRLRTWPQYQGFLTKGRRWPRMVGLYGKCKECSVLFVFSWVPCNISRRHYDLQLNTSKTWDLKEGPLSKSWIKMLDGQAACDPRAASDPEAAADPRADCESCVALDSCAEQPEQPEQPKQPKRGGGRLRRWFRKLLPA